MLGGVEEPMQDGVQHIVSDRVQYPGDHDIPTIVIAFHLLVLNLSSQCKTDFEELCELVEREQCHTELDEV